MHIERIEISGFKGISSLEFEPGQLNLITGANNSGKTSLLEAVELAFDPTKVEKYGERVEDLVHVDFEEAEISVEYREEVGNGSERIKNQNIRMTDAKQRNILNPVIESVSQEIQTQEDFREAFGLKDIEFEEESPRIPELVAQGGRMLSEEVLSELESRVKSDIVIEFEDTKYRFTQFDESVRLASKVGDKLAESVIEVAQEFSDYDSDNQDIDASLVGFRFVLESAVSGGVFIQGSPPESNETIRFLGSKLLLSDEDIDLDQENAAVRLSDIEDYLKEHDLVENLDTLSLDQMVYEEDGEKYQVPYEFTGDGFKTLLGLLWELSGDDDEILLLEEPENHLHPRYIRQLVYWLVGVVEDTETQLFLTTHDLDFIRSFFDFVDEPRKEFLSDHFQLLKMDPEMPETYGYDDAREIALDLQIDLRGI